MSIRDRIKQHLIDCRDTILNGGVNCIPSPFTRFREDFPGVRKGFYYLVSGATKSSKTQLTTYLFIVNSIFYYINNPDKIKPTIHIFPLEETPEDITLRFYSYVIAYLSKERLLYSPEELESVDERNPLNQEVLDLMDSPEFIRIANVYEECVIFHEDQRNPTGINKTIEDYLKNNGKIEYIKKDIKFKDEFGVERVTTINKFDKYIPNNPNEYVMFIVDHVGLLQQERGFTLKETIEKLSEYCVKLRNKYKAIPIIVQQQNTESTNLEAFKANKIRPVKDGLKDSKRTGEDCTVLIGITNPFSFGLGEYLGYNIKKLRDSFRVMEIVLSRKGKANGLCPLYFNGAVNQFRELPLPDNEDAINRIYHYIDDLRNYKKKPDVGKLFFIYKLNNIINKLKFKQNGKNCSNSWFKW